MVVVDVGCAAVTAALLPLRLFPLVFLRWWIFFLFYFFFFFSISYCPTTVWNYDFDSNSDLACLKCRGTQIRIYLDIDTDTDTTYRYRYRHRYRYRYIYRCEMRNAHTLHWIEVERKMNWLRYKVAASLGSLLGFRLLGSSSGHLIGPVHGPWSMVDPWSSVYCLVIVSPSVFFLFLFFLSSFLLFPSALECFKLSWA